MSGADSDETRLDPRKVLNVLVRDVPRRFHRNLCLIGSLAAAYHFRDELERRAVNTKDADIVVQPVGSVDTVRRIALALRRDGWTWTPYGGEGLPDVRLCPPSKAASYFVEFQGFPAREQSEPVVRATIEIEGDRHSVPCFRFAGLTLHDRQDTLDGIKYAHPAMMALANLLSHPIVGAARMSSPIRGRRLLRSAKDLGRVLAMAHLLAQSEVEGWIRAWTAALRGRFPRAWRRLGAGAGSGLRELLDDRHAFEEAWTAVDYGLLNRRQVTPENLRATGALLLAGLIEPFEVRCRSEKGR